MTFQKKIIITYAGEKKKPHRSCQNNLGSYCFLIIQCISENFQWIGLLRASPFLWVERSKNRKADAFTSGGVQALSLISSLSVEGRPKRKGRGSCPVESLRRQDDEFGRQWANPGSLQAQPGNTVPSRPCAGARTAIFVLDRHCGQHIYREDDREERVQKFIVTVPLLMGHQESNRSQSSSNKEKRPARRLQSHWEETHLWSPSSWNPMVTRVSNRY